MQVLAVRRKITGTCVPENGKQLREDDFRSSADSISHQKHKLPELLRGFYNSHTIIINSEDPVFLKVSIRLKIREYSKNSNCYHTCINIFLKYDLFSSLTYSLLNIIYLQYCVSGVQQNDSVIFFSDHFPLQVVIRC